MAKPCLPARKILIPLPIIFLWQKHSQAYRELIFRPVWPYILSYPPTSITYFLLLPDPGIWWQIILNLTKSPCILLRNWDRFNTWLPTSIPHIMKTYLPKIKFKSCEVDRLPSTWIPNTNKPQLSIPEKGTAVAYFSYIFKHFLTRVRHYNARFVCPVERKYVVYTLLIAAKGNLVL